MAKYIFVLLSTSFFYIQAQDFTIFDGAVMVSANENYFEIKIPQKKYTYVQKFMKKLKCINKDTTQNIAILNTWQEPLVQIKRVPKLKGNKQFIFGAKDSKFAFGPINNYMFIQSFPQKILYNKGYREFNSIKTQNVYANKKVFLCSITKIKNKVEKKPGLLQTLKNLFACKLPHIE